MDTYAGTTLVSQQLARQLELKVSDSQIELYSVNGARLPVCGETVLTVRNGTGGGMVRFTAAVVPTLEVEGVDVLLGVNAHESLGKVIKVDLRSRRATYCGAVRAQDCDVIEEADYKAVRRDGVWEVAWVWKNGVPTKMPRGPTVYKKGWISASVKETAFSELKTWFDLGILQYVGEVNENPDRGWLPINLVLQEHKPSTPVRVAIDLKWLNARIEYKDEFSKYEVAGDTIREWRSRGDGYLCDLSKAFLRVKIDADQRKFLTIRVGSSLYEVTALPFGISVAPRILCEILSRILSGIDGVSFFRDDVYVKSLEVMDQVIEVLKRNGFISKPIERVGLDMEKPVKLLGLTVSVKEDLNCLWWRREEKTPGEHKVPELEQLTARQALGYLGGLLPGMIPTANWLRPLVASLRSRCTMIATNGDWDDLVAPPNSEVYKEFMYLRERWAETGNPMQGVWDVPQDNVKLYTDASDRFLGYVITDEELRPIADSCQPIKETTQINISELDAVIFGVQQCIEYGFKKIELLTDSSSVVGWLKAISTDAKVRVRGIHAKLIDRRVVILRKMVREFELNIRVAYVKSKDNLADALTRISPGKKVVGAVTEGVEDRRVAYPRTLQAVREGSLADIDDVIESLHMELLHPSPANLEAAMRRLGYSSCTKQVLASINRCHHCFEKRARLRPWTSSGQSYTPGSGEVFMDSLKISTESPAQEFTGLVTVIDADSRMARIYPYRESVTSSVTTAALMDWISCYRCEIVRTDNGAEFANTKFEEVCERHNIRHRKSSVGHPQSNGLIERFHRTLLNYIKVQFGDGHNWYIRALEGLRVYNRTPHSGLNGSTPLEAYVHAHYGEEENNTGERLEEEGEDVDDIRLSLAENQEPFKVGETVCWRDPNNRNKDRSAWRWGTILEYKGRGAYLVKFGTKKQRIVNRELLTSANHVEHPTNTQRRTDTEQSVVMQDTPESAYVSAVEQSESDNPIEPSESDNPTQQPESPMLRRSLRNRKQPKRYHMEE